MKLNYPKTLKAVNKFLQHEIKSTILVVMGEGYFYITSDDETTALEIAGLPQTSIYVNNVSDISFESWYEIVTKLLNGRNVATN